MKLKVFLCTLILCCFLGTSFYAENMPKDKLSEIREYPESLVQHVDKYDVNKLVKDDYFVRTLSKELKNKNTTAEEKVYIFYLMMQKIRWAFCGGLDVPLSDNYAHNSLFQCITIYKYRQRLSKLGIDDKQFFDLTFNDIEEKPILAAYSFLLGSLVAKDINNSLSVCKDALLEKDVFEKPTWFRSMFIHNMMLMSQALINIPHEDPYSDYSRICHTILGHFDCKEEEKEDLVIGQFFDSNIDNFGSVITHHLLNEKNRDNDCFVLTCFNLVQNRLDEDNFKFFVNMILEDTSESEEDAWKKNIIENHIIANDYNVDYFAGMNVKTGIYKKSWDDISMIAYDDGILYYDDNYAEFQPNNNK